MLRVAAVRRSIAFCIAGCVLLLTACRVPGAVRPTVKIGLVAPFEGRYRYVGYDLFPAVRLALREVNAAGGVGGYAVELVAYDDEGDPMMAIQQARKLAVDTEVMVALGHFRAETTAAAIPYYAAAGLPLVASGGLEPVTQVESAGVFPLGPDAETVARMMLQGVGTAALVSQGGPLGQALEAVASQEGMLLAPVVSPDEPGWLEEVLAAAPSVVLCDADPVTAGEVVTALRGAGWRGEFRGGPSLAAADFATVAGEAAEGAEFPLPRPLPGAAAVGSEFIAAYMEISGGAPPGPLALPAYQAARQILEALAADIAAHGAPSRAGALMSLAEGRSEGGCLDGHQVEARAPVNSQSCALFGSRTLWLSQVFLLPSP